MANRKDDDVRFIYHIKVVRGRFEKPHPCNGYTVTTLPSAGYYAENPHVIDMPPGQRVKIVTDGGETILIPRDGRVAYVMDSGGNTIDTYPKKRAREEERERAYGLKVGERS
jgi:hypothetical protein